MVAHDYKLIPLSRGLYARVSPQDYERLSKFKWCVCFEGSTRRPYAVRFVTLGPPNTDNRKRRRRKVKMHREVLELGPFCWVDNDRVPHHVDGDGLNNTRENLQVLTYSQNASLTAKKRKVDEPWL